MKNISILMTAGAVMLTAAACNSNKQVAVNNAGVVKTETLNQTEGVINQVLFGEWTVADVGGKAVTGENRPYVIFDRETSNPFEVRCYANDGCNYINGAYAVTPGGKMQRINEFISTMRMCHDAPYEMGITLALNSVHNYAIEKVAQDYLLYFKNEAGQNTMVLRKCDISFINGAWKVETINGKEAKSADDLLLVIDIPEQKIHGNVGCNTLNGSISVNFDKQNAMSFSNLATTRMTCPDIATEQELLAALAKVETVIPGNNADTAQLKDAAGQTVITLSKINLK